MQTQGFHDLWPQAPIRICRRLCGSPYCGVSGNKTKRAIGWREWVALPDLGVDAIEVKVDTGARSSALHAYDLRSFEKDGVEYVRFTIHPGRRDLSISVENECPVVARRWITSSSGHRTRRPVIRTSLDFYGQSWPIELTLTNRDTMGFRMLLGRQAIQKRFLVDVSKSHQGGMKP